MTGRFWIALGAFLAGTAVAAGAVGAHVLEETYELPAEQLQTYETAVRYQMYHALGLLVVGLVAARRRSVWATAAGCAFLIGIILFSGGLYAWLWSGESLFVRVVPIGGLAWIIGWLLLVGAAIGTSTSQDRPTFDG